MRKRWIGPTLLAVLALAVSAQAQTPEPMPFAPSTVDGPPAPPSPPPMFAQQPEGSNVLPADIPNIATPPQRQPDPYRVYVNLEYLNWWMKNDKLNGEVVTTTPFTNLLTSQGALFQPGTVVIGGAGDFHQGPMNGLRGTIGFAPDWFVPVEVSGFYTHAQKNVTVASNATGNPLLGRAIFDLDPAVNQEAVDLISIPNLAKGFISTNMETVLAGAEVDAYLWRWLNDPNQVGPQLSLTGGARYAVLNESLEMDTRTTPLTALLPAAFLGQPFGPPNVISTADHFDSRNSFYGAQLGFRASLPLWIFNLDFKGNTGVGVNQQIMNINGVSAVTPPSTPSLPPPPPIVTPGGLQALPSNSGRFTAQKISTISDLTVNLEWPITDQFSFSVGYNFLYWTSVVRPGEQVSHFVDGRQVPTDIGFVPNSGATSPPFTFSETNFWAQGISLSLAYLY